MASFTFRFHPLYRLLGAPFGITSRTTMVEVASDHLEVRFGPWFLRTPVANVAGCETTGPFSIHKTVGPARLSLADGGLTFATNPDAGLCVRFLEPVPAIDPLGLIRHRGVTLTVDRVVDLQEALTRRPPDPGSEHLRVGMAAESPWSVLRRWSRWPAGMALATIRHLRSVADIERSFESRRGWPDALADLAEDVDVQSVKGGVGPVFERTYQVRMSGAERSPEELMALMTSDFNRMSPVEVAEFTLDRPSGPKNRPGTEYLVRMPGPWNGPIRVVESTPTSIRFATLRGHMEAGEIEFRSSWHDAPAATGGARDLLFEIRSLARSGDRLVDFLYDRIPLAREMQLHMWCHFCRRVATSSGGGTAGKIQVHTIRHERLIG